MTPKNETLIVPVFDARNNRVFAQAAEDDTLKALLPEDAYDADVLVSKIECLGRGKGSGRGVILTL